MEHQHAKPRANERLFAYSSVLYGQQLFERDHELAMLLDNVAAVLSEHATMLAEEIADRECDDRADGPAAKTTA